MSCRREHVVLKGLCYCHRVREQGRLYQSKHGLV